MTTTSQPRRVLLCATAIDDQVRRFDDAAARLGVELVLAVDHGARLDDAWRQRAVAVDYHDEAASTGAVIAALGARGVDGVVAVDDRPVVVTALIAERLGIRWHEVEGARVSRDVRRVHERLRAAGLPVPDGVVPGAAMRLEGVLDHGVLHVLAVLEAFDPAADPAVEATRRVTPAARAEAARMRVIAAVAPAVRAAGLVHGAVHAECRVTDDRVVVLEVAARPVSDPHARALRFQAPDGAETSLEGLLLRAAVSEWMLDWRRTADVDVVLDAAVDVG